MTHAFLIGRSDGSNSNLDIIFDRIGCCDVRRIEASALCEEDLIRVQNLFVFGLLHKTWPVVRVSNVDQGLRPLSDGASFEVSDTIFSNDRTHGFDCTELVGQISDRQ